MTYALTKLLVYSLAVYRVALLLSDDDGPYKMFSKLRSWLKREAREHPAVRKSAIRQGITCIRCASIWVAAPVAVWAIFYSQLPRWLAMLGDGFIFMLALSMAAILLHRLMPETK